MTTSKTIHRNDGVYIICDEKDAEEIDFDSMLPQGEENPKKKEREEEPGDKKEDIYGPTETLGSSEIDIVEVNGHKFEGRLKICSVTKNILTGKTITKIVLIG